MSAARPSPSDPVRAYLDRIGSIPRLTPAQELELGTAVADGARARARLASPAAEHERAHLLGVVRAGEAARATMISANLRLVVAQARRFSHSPVPFLDLVQEGNVGLVRAVDRYDARRGFRFSTYATDWIAQAIGQALASDRLIRLPPKANRMLIECRRVRDLLHDELGRSPSEGEIAAAAGVDEAMVRRVLRVEGPTLSIDHPSAGHHDRAAEWWDEPAVRAQRGAVAEVLEEAVAQLRESERRVLALRFGLGCRRHSRREAADALGLAVPQVRALERAALQRMRGRAAVVRLREGSIT